MLAVAAKVRRFPKDYKHVNTPSIPKKEDSDKPFDQRLLSVFQAANRVEVGAWY